MSSPSAHLHRAPDAVRDGEPAVDGHSVAATADRLIRLLSTPELAHTMGERGRHWVQAEGTWEHSYATLAELLHSARAAG
ncbi:glycosyltransferase [Streptomyces sp. NPDC046925]|uniref:glycosyltransferase family protein n=1 Tax=Streptomyces sp. NPDC046925 TaxID=3155375 RepID=UPI0033C150B2